MSHIYNSENHTHTLWKNQKNKNKTKQSIEYSGDTVAHCEIQRAEIETVKIEQTNEQTPLLLPPAVAVTVTAISTAAAAITVNRFTVSNDSTV